jgi:DNA-binding winged helix-turn-helix (wHTH) protein
VRVRVLGSLRLGEDDGAPLQSARVRRLFAVLLVHRGMAVSADRIAQVVWGDRQPADPSAAVQTLVWRLRQALRAARCDGAARLLTRAPGYLLEAEGEQVDLVRFERLVRAATREPLNTQPTSSRRPCRCGGDRPTPSSPMTTSSGPRPPGLRRFGSPHAQTGSTRYWRWTARTRPSPGWLQLSRRTRYGSDPGRSRCARCTGSAAPPKR